MLRSLVQERVAVRVEEDLVRELAPPAGAAQHHGLDHLCACVVADCNLGRGTSALGVRECQTWPKTPKYAYIKNVIGGL